MEDRILSSIALLDTETCILISNSPLLRPPLGVMVDDLTEGDYTLINFHADPTVIAELDRVLRINDAVKRHMIVRRADKE